jgi:hypothetical protein
MGEATSSAVTGRFETDYMLMQKNAWAKYIKQPILDLTMGGQHGWSPVLKEWISNQAYVRRQLIPILLEAPEFFKFMDAGDGANKWVATLRALVELHPRTIEGFSAGLTVELDEHPVGGGGEMQQEFTDVKRARSEPVFTFTEKYGMPIQAFLYNWITYGLMDPETKTAMVGTLEGSNGNADSYPPNMLASWYSMTMMFIEPDPTHRKVQKAWITTNMFPKGTGEIIGKRDLTTASEVLNLNVEFTGVSQYNLGTVLAAQEILDWINITNANPYLREAFVSAIGTDVLTGTESVKTGFQTGVTNLATSAEATMSAFNGVEE